MKMTFPRIMHPATFFLRHASVALLFFAGASPLKAQFNYTTNNGTIMITRYTGPGGNVIIPDFIDGLPVTTINVGAFWYATGMTNVTFGTNVVNILNQAFGGCSGLTMVTIPNSVTNIDYYAFSSCGNLTSINLGANLKSLGHQAFWGCPKLREISVDAANTDFRSIDGVLFDQAQQTTLMLYPADKPESDYNIPDGVRTIGDSAFWSCLHLTNVNIPNSVIAIANSAFDSSNIRRVIIPDSVRNIGEAAFINCFGLIDVSIGNSLTNLGASAFESCTNLAHVEMSDGVDHIGARAFWLCSALASITVPNSVTTIGERAFGACAALTNFTVPRNVSSIGPNTFFDCISVASIFVEQDNSFYSSLEGVLYDKNQTTLIHYPAARAGTFMIPSGVITIGEAAFRRCPYLVGVAVPNTVTRIGYRAFSSCSNLIQISPLMGVTNIEWDAFSYCGLTNVTFGPYLRKVDDYAFAYCVNLTGAYFQGDMPTCGMYAFDGNGIFSAYFLPGTTGWNPNGRFIIHRWVLPQPTVLHLPPNFGMRSNAFGFRISWATNATVVVEACTNLLHGEWIPFGTNTVTMGVDRQTDGWSYFSDPQWTNAPTRFYRIRSP